MKKQIPTKEKLTMAHFSVVVCWEDLERTFGEREYNKFIKWMSDQTSALYGVYPSDLEKYLNNSKSFD